VAVSGWLGSIVVRSSKALAFASILGGLGGLGLVAATEQALAGRAMIGGVMMSCYAANVVITDQADGPGFALPGEIIFNPKYLAAYPPIVQRLVFLHECGHQYIGNDETSADCWAVRAAKRQGWLTPAGLKQACRALWHTEGDGVHLAGPERCAALNSCYGAAPGSVKRARRTKR
jgi:hypothetical protein